MSATHGTIADVLKIHASAGGGAAAFAAIDAPPFTYAQLVSSIESCGRQLAVAGRKPGDRIAAFIPPGIPGARLAVALACNAALVPVSPMLTAHEVHELFRATQPDAVVMPAWHPVVARAAIQASGIATLEAAREHGDLRFTALARGRHEREALSVSQRQRIALLLRSSGTSGSPKIIPVTDANLLAMAEKFASPRWFGLSAADRVPCTLPLHYAAGLKTALLVPLILGQTVLFPAPEAAFDVARWIDRLRPTYLSVGPTSLNAMLESYRRAPADFDGDSLRFIICGAAHLPDSVRRYAESVFRVPVLEYYALSEAGAMAANPAPPGKAKPGTAGLADPELRLVDDDGSVVARGHVGEIVVSGPSVTPGYVAADGGIESGPEEGVRTGDLGRIDEDGYLTVVARLKEVINRGGEKVFPYEVEREILRHPDVQDAAVFGVPHPRLGEMVAAAVVVRPGSAPSEEELKAFVAPHLAAFKLPRRLYFVPTLPRGSTGKVLRRALTETYGYSRHDRILPDDLLEVELRDLWSRLLGTDEIGIDDDFLEIGGDSLLAAEMLSEVERLTGRPYPRSQLATLTIRRIAEVAMADVPASQSLVTQVKWGKGIPLFFCHGDFFTRGIYAHRLAALLPADQPVFLLHYPIERLAGTSLEQMAQAYADEVVRMAPGSPVFIGGWCNGGLTAWHVVHLLRKRGVRVVELFLVDTISLNARPGSRGFAMACNAAAAALPGAAAQLVMEKAMPVLWTARRIRTVSGFAARLRGAARKGLRKALRKNGAALPLKPTDRAAQRTSLLLALSEPMSRYVPPRIDVPVSCFLAKEGSRFDTDPAFWRGLAPVVTETTVPGTHLTSVVSERKALAAALGDALKRAVARHARAAERAPEQVITPRASAGHGALGVIAWLLHLPVADVLTLLPF